MVMIIKSICGVAAFSSALYLAGAARVDDEQAQQPLPQSTSSLKKEHAMAVEAQTAIMQTQMANQEKALAAKAKAAGEKKEKADAAFKKAKKDVAIASQKEDAAIEASTAAEAAQVAASEAKDKQQLVYGKSMGHLNRTEETMKEATEAKVAALAESKKADETLAQLQDEMHVKVKEATKDREVTKSAEAVYKAAKAKTDDLSKLAKRVALSKVMTEKMACEASAAAKGVSAEEKKLSTKLQTLTDQKDSTDAAANVAQAKAETTEAVSTKSTGLAMSTHKEKVKADGQAIEDAEVAQMFNDGAGATQQAPLQQKVAAANDVAEPAAAEEAVQEQAAEQ